MGTNIHKLVDEQCRNRRRRVLLRQVLVVPFVLLGYLKVMLPGALSARRLPTDTVLVCPWRSLRARVESIRKGVDKGGARGLKPPQFWRSSYLIILLHTLYFEGKIFAYTHNNIQAPPLLQTCLRPWYVPVVLEDTSRVRNGRHDGLHCRPPGWNSRIASYDQPSQVCGTNSR